MPAPHSEFNRALSRIPKRAEHRQAEQLRDTFLDSGVAVILDTVDNQVLYGRRGTGKTHALRYLESLVVGRGDIAFYADLRTVGSPDGLYNGGSIPVTERASRLLVDLLNAFSDALIESVLDIDDLSMDQEFNRHLESLEKSISSIRVQGTVEFMHESTESDSATSEVGVSAQLSEIPTLKAGIRDGASQATSARNSETVRGEERLSLNFSEIARALRNLSNSLSPRRIWFMLDEWSSVPSEIQPLLGEFLIRCVTPNTNYTTKLAAIEQQSNFSFDRNGQRVGIELGADFSANANLDEVMVYEQDPEKSIDFFSGLLFKHLTTGGTGGDEVSELHSESDLVRLGFTDRRAFDELVRAAEGVPRDFIHVAGKAGYKAVDRKISVNDVRGAAQSWFQQDKEGALKGNHAAKLLLNWIIDKVIRGKRARGFLVNQRHADHSLLLSLFDARVLHLVKRGYSAQDQPGERYDVWLIDYGAYVDLMRTKNEPAEMIPGFSSIIPSERSDVDQFEVEVPEQDLRAIRRAILNLGEFEDSLELSTKSE